MKHNYIAPCLDVVDIKATDVISTSTPFDGEAEPIKKSKKF